MSDFPNQAEEMDTEADSTVDVAPPVLDEKALLRNRAKMMGIKHSPNIGNDKLRELIEARMNGETVEEAPAPVAPAPAPVVAAAPVAAPVVAEKPKSLRQKIYEENMRLVRCRIANLNPEKKDLPGEIYTVANKYLGTVRKYVPFGEVSEEGYHLPFVIYQEIDSKRFLQKRQTKDPRTGREKVEQVWAKEFAIEVLPQLTQDELNKLALAQQAAGNS